MTEIDCGWIDPMPFVETKIRAGYMFGVPRAQEIQREAIHFYGYDLYKIEPDRYYRLFIKRQYGVVL